MNKIITLLGGIGGGGVLITGSWFVYDTSNPTLIKIYGGKWNPIETKPEKPSTNNEPYKGSSCFQKFFGKVEIQNFYGTGATTSGSTSSESEGFNTLFESTNSNIYGCAVGDGNDFYELVLKNEKIGFATWFDSNQNNAQKTFKLTKESNETWKIELGIWSTDTTLTKDKNFKDQIQNKTSKEENWTWFFMLPQSTASENMQKWSDVFEWKNKMAYYKDNKWNQNSSFSVDGGGQIPKFEKVQDLDDFCNKQGNIRKNQENTVNKEKLNVYCLVKSS